MLSPVRYGQRKFRAGGTSGSVFSLIAATLGSGTISFPYAVMMNGYILGPMLIVLGACVSYYTGMLIVRCSENTNRTRYEDIADAIYGKKVARMTSFCNLACLIAFTIAYIVYIKKAVPEIIEHYQGKENVPEWIGNTDDGKKVWGTLFSFLVLFPISLTRSVNALRYSSLFGVLCSMYLCIAVTFVFFIDKDVVPDWKSNFSRIEAFRVSYNGIVSTFPLIIFAYMYQVNIPMIYVELETRNKSTMGKVIGWGSAVAVLFYIMVGVFGYATFLAPGDSPNSTELCSKNILSANYKGNTAIQIGNFALLISVISASPLVVLPSKDTVEELFYKKEGMNKRQNCVVTLGLVTISWILALFIGTIGDAMTLVGSTINPVIGFLLPIVFYWPSIKDQPWHHKDKILSVLIAIVIILVSVLSLVNFFQTLG